MILESMMGEDRFDLQAPKQPPVENDDGEYEESTEEAHRFYGIDNIEVGYHDVNCVGNYIFVFKDNMFDLDIETSMEYPEIKNELGKLWYKGMGTDLRPVFTTTDDEDYDLTDKVIKSEPIVQEFMKSISEQLNVDVRLDFSFDISEKDPSYSSKISLSTLNKDTPADVFRKLNNIAFLLKDYITNFKKYVVKPSTKVVFGSDYKLFLESMTYYLEEIEFVGKQDKTNDMRRTRIYNKWFKVAGKALGNMTSLNLQDIYFTAKYKGTRIA